MIPIFCCFLMILTQCQQKEQEAKEDPMVDLIEKNLALATAQYKYMATRIPLDRMPKTYYSETDSMETSNTGWWTSGFYPGTLLYLYEQTGDQELLDLASQKLTILEKEQFNTGTHDLGFMLFCSFGNANRLSENEAYKKVMLQGAESLSSRFKSEVGLIQSWGSGKWKYPVIIDNMMNLEFLFWAAKESGNEKFKEIAITHADNTIKNHFREDYSSIHVIDYDPETGAVIARNTAQGLADESAWARGQAWGLYGFTVMFRETLDPKYLDQAVKIAEFTLNHPKLPADLIPLWDYDVEADENTLRDASAAAINASALLELSKYVEESQSKKYLNAAKTILQNLSTEKYLAKKGENGGFILKHSVGHFPAGTEVDTPLTYADYYFIEALIRYKNWML